jgi:hypothetical protein
LTSRSIGSGSNVTPVNALPSPLDAVDDLRSAARWTLAAAGGVGTILLSGGPLVAVGQIHGFSHAIVAGAGLAVALAGVGLAIWQTSQVLIPRVTTPTIVMMPALAPWRAEIDRSPSDYFGSLATSVQDLLRHQAVAASLARQLAREPDPRRRRLFEKELRRVEGNAARAAPYVRWLLAAAHVWTIQADLRRAQRATLAGALLVVVGAVALFSATGQGPTYVPVLTPQVTATPTVSP